MGANDLHSSRKDRRFGLFLPATNEARITYSYSQFKIGYSELALREPHFYF